MPSPVKAGPVEMASRGKRPRPRRPIRARSIPGRSMNLAECPSIPPNFSKYHFGRDRRKRI